MLIIVSDCCVQVVKYTWSLLLYCLHSKLEMYFREEKKTQDIWRRMSLQVGGNIKSTAASVDTFYWCCTCTCKILAVHQFWTQCSAQFRVYFILLFSRLIIYMYTFRDLNSSAHFAIHLSKKPIKDKKISKLRLYT